MITEIEIENFRSIKKCKIDKIKDFNALFGLNNSGKSNILRALNLFFNNETDNGQFIEFNSDFHKTSSRKKKEIKITVKFKLPKNFKFKKTLKKVENTILKGNREIKITKFFGQESDFPERIFLNGNKVSEENIKNIGLFLNLINFRYIPNRVLPVEILKEEGDALKIAIARKVNKQKTNKQEIAEAAKHLSETFRKISKSFTEPIAKEFQKFSQKIEIELITPSKVEDLISTSGYFFHTNNTKIEDIYQGSGIQSLLMFHTLHLIDKDYAQQFGWKQATIWAVEEPESSLHFDLEAQLALFLFQTVTKDNNRLQFFCTTHSTMFAQYSQQTFFIKKPPNSNETACEIIEPKKIYQKIIDSGISKYTDPLLYWPNQHILLCEGKRDITFIKKAFELLELNNSDVYITCLAELEDRQEIGGADTIKEYIKSKKEIIKLRNTFNTNIIVLLDWDININNDWSKIKKINGVHIVKWPEEKVLPKTKKIKGIESFYPERFFDEAFQKDEFKEILSKDGKQNYAYIKGQQETSRINSLKEHLIKKVKNELSKKDIDPLEGFIQNKLLKLVSS